jgi:hypothetical protein
MVRWAEDTAKEILRAVMDDDRNAIGLLLDAPFLGIADILADVDVDRDTREQLLLEYQKARHVMAHIVFAITDLIRNAEAAGIIVNTDHLRPDFDLPDDFEIA